ncbi:hypoxanthine-guanine phosphoribosyltransferase [Betaproteobacteria bacterium]|nr:hypoxanthine-guanine phosphoribosyltransferase [Betaproteobacteria bacterium]GHT97955.1 hypoxanthine-guanine phosphoribosyltransferase [Betaproteobacteria bacterium]GHU14586.1 hypoxanthine-guanine phosphoribosyltransferase [Betaproteobacteria bacterium]GHU18690.1 hypoxanthine-guanine phosphoribosyltransferase [Betaproteobacteria bacterium]
MDLDHNRLLELRRIRDEADCLADVPTVEAALNRMAAEITARLAHTDPLVCTIMNGGLILAGQLLPRLDFPLELAYLHASRYGKHTQGREIAWRVSPPENLAGRMVLVLDDVLDEGHTLAAVLERLRASGAQEALSAVLVHKNHEHKAIVGMRADFTGLELENRFLFGYGMDYRGYWRNAPGIFAVKGL